MTRVITHKGTIVRISGRNIRFEIRQNDVPYEITIATLNNEILDKAIRRIGKLSTIDILDGKILDVK